MVGLFFPVFLAERNLVVRHVEIDDGENSVIPAKAGIQWCTTGFRVKPGMTRFLSICFNMTDY